MCHRLKCPRDAYMAGDYYLIVFIDFPLSLVKLGPLTKLRHGIRSNCTLMTSDFSKKNIDVALRRCHWIKQRLLSSRSRQPPPEKSKGTKSSRFTVCIDWISLAIFNINWHGLKVGSCFITQFLMCHLKAAMVNFYQQWTNLLCIMWKGSFLLTNSQRFSFLQLIVFNFLIRSSNPEIQSSCTKLYKLKNSNPLNIFLSRSINNSAGKRWKWKEDKKCNSQYKLKRLKKCILPLCPEQNWM